MLQEFVEEFSGSRKQLRRGSAFWVVARTVVGFRRRKRFRGFCAFADGKCRLLLQLQGCEDSFVVLEPLEWNTRRADSALIRYSHWKLVTGEKAEAAAAAPRTAEEMSA
jgi:hypothetical protein